MDSDIPRATPNLLEVMKRANQWARTDFRPEILFADVLFAITYVQSCEAYKLLQGFQVSDEDLQNLAKGLRPGYERHEVGAVLPKSINLKKAIDIAQGLSLRMNCNYLGTEHLLLAILFFPLYSASLCGDDKVASDLLRRLFSADYTEVASKINQMRHERRSCPESEPISAFCELERVSVLS